VVRSVVFVVSSIGRFVRHPKSCYRTSYDVSCSSWSVHRVRFCFAASWAQLRTQDRPAAGLRSGLRPPTAVASRSLAGLRTWLHIHTPEFTEIRWESRIDGSSFKKSRPIKGMPKSWTQPAWVMTAAEFADLRTPGRVSGLPATGLLICAKRCGGYRAACALRSDHIMAFKAARRCAKNKRWEFG
jgi:hypothetical protein